MRTMQSFRTAQFANEHLIPSQKAEIRQGQFTFRRWRETALSGLDLKAGNVAKGLIFSTLVALLVPLATAQASVVSPSDCLPPPDEYTAAVHSSYGFPAFILANISHAGFITCNSPPGPGDPPTMHSFGSIVSGDASSDGGVTFMHFTAPANVTVKVAFNSQVGNIRFFDTEMLQLDISGGSLPPGVIIRESPTLMSLGQTSIEFIPLSGMFTIASFFDVFTELSLDNGTRFEPCSPCARVELQRIPEPSTLFLMGCGFAGLALWRRRVKGGNFRIAHAA